MSSSKEIIKISISDEERFALMQFRQKVSDCCTKPYHDDRYLLRWLRARKFNVNAAEKMLRDSMVWREKWNVDSLSEWSIPEVYKLYYPWGTTGFDKDGSPIIIVIFGGLDTYGLLHSAPRNFMVKVTIKILENFLELGRKQAQLHGCKALKLTCIIDMADFNLKQFTFRPAADVMISMIQMYEANYPEVLKECHIINVPRVFQFAFNVVKGFLNEYTLGKITLYRTCDEEKWKRHLLQLINPDQLPSIFGGSLTDPDGNPRCLTLVNQGGKVPKSYYIQKSEPMKCGDCYTCVLIKKGTDYSLKFQPSIDGMFLRWSFYTDDHDIKFGVYSTDEKSSVVQTHIPLRKVSSHCSEEIGFIPCCISSTYNVVFDNKSSYFTNKTLYYKISLTGPIEDKKDIEPELFEQQMQEIDTIQ